MHYPGGDFFVDQRHPLNAESREIAWGGGVGKTVRRLCVRWGAWWITCLHREALDQWS